eukprot:scaffold139468_cov211-Phaeocystis_antarctica.AAC.1
MHPIHPSQRRSAKAACRPVHGASAARAEACGHIAARLIRCGGRDGLAVGPEQQLHHVQRRTFISGVVQRQLFILRDAVPKAASAGRAASVEGGGRKYEG